MPVPVEGRAPRRVQQMRTGGWRKPETAKSVARPSKWGNPYRVGKPTFPHQPEWAAIPMALRIQAERNGEHAIVFTAQTAVQSFRSWLVEHPSLMRQGIEELRGFDLMCWCPLVTDTGDLVPCHADVWLALANGA